jgi:hypothetical protein
MSTELNEKIDRLQLEVSQLREMAMMQVAILQVIGIKLGANPKDYAARSPVPVPSPDDLKKRLDEWANNAGEF